MVFCRCCISSDTPTLIACRVWAVCCLIFDSIYALLYFFALISYWMENDHKESCWEEYGYGGHPRYVWYAVISAFTTVFCLGGVVIHSNQLCCLQLNELKMDYFREAYLYMCWQVLWMGLSIILELMVPQVKTEDLPTDCRDPEMKSHERSKRVLIDFTLMICWLSWLVCRTAGAYTAFILCSAHGEIEKGVVHYTGGWAYVKSCEDMVKVGGIASPRNDVVGAPVGTGLPVRSTSSLTGTVQPFEISSVSDSVVGEPMTRDGNAITVYDGVQLRK